MADRPTLHTPVMVAEVVEYLQASQRGTVLADLTIGYGGHSQALTGNFDSADRLIGVDRDEEALAHCREQFRDAPFAVSLHHRRFSEIGAILQEEEISGADRILIDCGFSSPQIDRAERGFSFQREGPLDMRMDSQDMQKAEDIVNEWSERELTDLFKRYGDERFARKIAKNLVRDRAQEPIKSTQRLADLILQSIPERYQMQEGIHPATRVFQALRIQVNQELEELRQGLDAALQCLAPGGRIGVLSYHSLEHRIVKEKFREFCGRGAIEPGPAQLAQETEPNGILLTKKGVTPCAAEKHDNPRSRSAQFRVLERLAHH